MLVWSFLAKQQARKGRQPNSGLVKEFDFSYQQQKSCLDGNIRNWAAFWLKRGKKEKPLGNFLNYLVGYDVRKESGGSLCKLGS